MNAPNQDEQDTRDMQLLAGGHEPALDELMNRHSERLFQYLVRSLQDEEDAVDLAQETFVKVYQGRTRFDPRQRFSTWLYAIASNLVRDRYRWRSRHPQVSLDAESGENAATFRDSLPEPGPTPREHLQAAERADAVRQAVAALPEELRAPLILAEYQGFPQADIARVLGCTVKAVETRIYRARQQLRAGLGKFLGNTKSTPP